MKRNYQRITFSSKKIKVRNFDQKPKEQRKKVRNREPRT